MTPVLIFAGLLVLSLTWHYGMYKRSGRPWWNPLWMAFTLTALGLVRAVTGFIGYDLPLHNPFIDGPAPWMGHVLWSHVARGAVLLLISAPLWWLGLRGLRGSNGGDHQADHRRAVSRG